MSEVRDKLSESSLSDDMEQVLLTLLALYIFEEAFCDLEDEW